MKEWLRRALRTFWQALFGFASANIVLTMPSDYSGGDIKTLVVGFLASAVAAGFAAVMNMERKSDK